MYAQGIATKPSTTRTPERKDRSGTFTIHTLELLDDTAGVVVVQSFAKENPFVGLTRGDQLRCRVTNVAFYGGVAQLDVDEVERPTTVKR